MVAQNHSLERRAVNTRSRTVIELRHDESAPLNGTHGRLARDYLSTRLQRRLSRGCTS